MDAADDAPTPVGRRGIKDILAGVVFVAFGLAFAVAATSYELGSTLEMGPGYFPLVLGGILAVLGVVIVVKGYLAGETGAIGPVAWRAAILITGAIVFFGLTVRGLGLVPSIFATAVLSGIAGHRTGLVLPLVIAVGLTIVSVLIFVVALQLRLPLIGPWIGL
jgi:hypothetical protein